MIKRFKEVLIITVIMVLSLSVFAQVIDTIVQIEEVSITSLKSPISRTAPIFRITSYDINHSDQYDYSRVLDRVSGVYMQTGALNTNRITIRGIGNRSPFSTNKIKAYLDEIPLSNGVGETVIEDIDMNFLESVNVWKGPASVLYGAGLGGMIHLKTKNNSPVLFSQTKGTAGISIGSFGLVNQQYLVQSQSARGSSLSLQYNDLKSNGYRDNNHYKRRSAIVLAQTRSQPNDKITLMINLIGLKAEIPSSLNREDFINDPSQAAFSWKEVNGRENNKRILTGLSYQNRFKKKYNLATSIFQIFQTNDEVRPFNILDEASYSTGYRVVLGREYKLSNNYKVVSQAGVEGRHETSQWQTFETTLSGKGPSLSDQEELRHNLHTFIQSSFKTGKYGIVTAGLSYGRSMYNYLSFDIDSIEEAAIRYQLGGVFSPSLGYKFEYANNHNAGINISHGYSNPSIEESRLPNGQLNNNIKPEQGWNFELGFEGRGTHTKWNYTLNMYIMKITDLLVAERLGPDEYLGINAGKTNHSGLEAFASYPIRLGSSFYLKPAIYYTFTNHKFIYFQHNGFSFDGNQLTGSPKHKSQLSVDAFFPKGWSLRMTWNYVSSYPMDDSNLEYTNEYQLIDASILYQGQLKNFSYEFYMGLKNLTNEKYASMVQINAKGFNGAPPRYFYPGLPIHWNVRVKVGYQF